MGRPGGFEDFMADQHAGLLRFAMTLTGDYRLSEELVADVLAVIFERWDRVGKVENPAGYVRKALVNQFVSRARRASRWHRLAPTLFAGQRAVEDASHEVSERGLMQRRLAQLPPRQRAVLSMRYYLDLPDEEIAEHLQCSPATVRSHAARGLSALRIAVDSDEVAEAGAPSGTKGRRT